MHPDVVRQRWWRGAWLLALALLAASCSRDAPLVVTPAQRTILDAMRAVESGNQADPPDGGGGRHIGPYQIGFAYWHDAAEAEASLRDGSFDDCRDRDYAERVVAAYMQRYCPEGWQAGDAEIIARTHIGGPSGPSEPSTLRYWSAVRALLASAGQR